MKKIFAITITTLLLINAIGQVNLTKPDKKALKIAQINLSKENFNEAFNMFSTLYNKYPKNSEVLFGIGVCKLNKRGEEKNALPILIEAYRNGNKNEDILFYLGKAYHIHHKFDEAQSSFEEYKTNSKNSIPIAEIDRLIEMAINAKKQILNQRNIEIVNIGPTINTASEESVPVILPNGKGMFFTSRRKGGFSDEKDYYGNYFQDIYFSEYKDHKWQTVFNEKTFNSKLNDGCVSISHDGSTLISYIVSDKGSKNTLSTNSDLYYSNYSDSTLWTSPINFGPSINSEHQEMSACFSLDKKTLYFSSNRPGGYGGFDLYKAKQLPNGAWGTAVNLGPIINTKHNEDAPFMHADGETFYFSSEGHSTMGGFDIFKSYERANKYWSTPVNIGYPINTVENDIYFTISEDNKTAYYSSDRQGSLGGQDIFKIKMFDAANYQEVIHCSIFNKQEKKAVNAKITLIDEVSHTLKGIYRPNGSGQFIMVILPGVDYQIAIEAEGYNSRILHMNFPESTDLYTNYEFNLVKKEFKQQ
jgi:hypothetical protein